MDHSNASILATLCYSDVFDYPLTKAQLWRYLILPGKLSFESFEHSLTRIPNIKKKNAFYYLSGRKILVEKRCKRKKISEAKLRKANDITNILTKIPTIDCVCLSGSLAMENAEKTADIDLFLITKKNTLWITRLLVLCILQIKNVRRKRESKKATDLVCINMLIDTNHMKFPKNRQDIYTAHEIMQMKPLFSRNFSYENFLGKNVWIAKILPNSFPSTALKKLEMTKKNTSSLLRVLEPVAKLIQLHHMKSHVTKETISNGFVAFHPYDYRKYVLEKWQERKGIYEISI